MKMEKTSTGKSINQKQGPRTGNTGTPEKRDTFMAEKSKVNSERSAIAKMITGALETRGRDNRSHRSPGVESLHDTTNTGRGPTKGNAGKSSKKGK
jgi:hypothetical protein